MSSKNWDTVIELLETITPSYYLEKELKATFKSNLQYRIGKYSENCRYFFQEGFEKKYSNIIPSAIIVPRKSGTNISKIANEAVIYFKQSLELFKTLDNVEENVSPLLEYYGLLQCVKGVVILELDVKSDKIFSKHGLTQETRFHSKIDEPKSTKKYKLKMIKRIKPSKYINAKIMPYGVLTSLIIRFTDHYDELYSDRDIYKISKHSMDKYVTGYYRPSLEEITTNHHVDPIIAFIGSWMLSTLVRYKAKMWQEICLGEKDDIINNIRKFRREKIPKAVETMLMDYVRKSSW